MVGWGVQLEAQEVNVTGLRWEQFGGKQQEKKMNSDSYAKCTPQSSPVTLTGRDSFPTDPGNDDRCYRLTSRS